MEPHSPLSDNVGLHAEVPAVSSSDASEIVVRSVDLPSAAFPKECLAGLAASGVGHVALLLLAYGWPGDSAVDLIPPQRGFNSVELIAAPSVVTPDPATDDVEIGSELAMRALPDFVSEAQPTALDARPLALARRRIVRALVGQRTEAASNLDNYTSVPHPKQLRPPTYPPGPLPVIEQTAERRPEVRKPGEPQVARVAKPSAAAAASRRSQGAEVDVPVRQIFSPQPVYPPQALAARLTGRAVLRVKVGADGVVVAAEVLQSSGVRSLDRAALTAIRRWRFQPARRAGVAIASEVAVPFRFRIAE